MVEPGGSIKLLALPVLNLPPGPPDTISVDVTVRCCIAEMSGTFNFMPTLIFFPVKEIIVASNN